jgi:hypothetical protein
MGVAVVLIPKTLELNFAPESVDRGWSGIRKMDGCSCNDQCQMQNGVFCQYFVQFLKQTGQHAPHH